MRFNPAMEFTVPRLDSLPVPPSCVHELVADQAARTPEAAAVEWCGQTLSYAELMERADLVAARLRSRGVGPDERVGILLDRGLLMAVAVLGVLKAGGACVPLDPQYPAERLAFMLEDSQAALLLTRSGLSRILPASECPMIFMDAGDAGEPSGPDRGPSAKPSAPSAGSLAYVIYTSGSTGQPKGVAMEHRPLVNLLRWHKRVLPMVPGERTLQFTSLSFDVSFQEILTTWSEGGTLVLIDEDTRRDPSALWRFLTDERITRLFLPFVALHHLAEAAEASDRTPGSLKDVITAGEQLQCTPGIRSLFRRLPGARLHNHYGPSETHVVTAYTLPGETDRWPLLPPIGTPVDNTVCLILDEQLQRVPPGEPGELYIGGECLARGYLGRPGLTEERFVCRPGLAGAGARLYRTGDLCRQLTDGNLEFLGRADTQVKIRGYRVEPGEVEAALKSHPLVQDAVVAVRGAGPVQKRLIGYVVPREESAPLGSDLREFLLRSLAEYMVPAQFVLIERLPLTPTGKVDRNALPEPAVDRLAPRPGLVAPAGPTETAVASIWAQLLDLPSVGVTESFFALGGTSLMLAQMKRRLKEALGREVESPVLYQFPTVRALAAHLDGGGVAPAALSDGARQRALLQRQAMAKAGRPAPGPSPTSARHG